MISDDVPGPAVPAAISGYDPNAPIGWPPRPLAEVVPKPPKNGRGIPRMALQGLAIPAPDGSTIIVVSETDRKDWLSCLVDGTPKELSRSWVLELKRRTRR